MGKRKMKLPPLLPRGNKERLAAFQRLCAKVKTSKILKGTVNRLPGQALKSLMCFEKSNVNPLFPFCYPVLNRQQRSMDFTIEAQLLCMEFYEL